MKRVLLGLMFVLAPFVAVGAFAQANSKEITVYTHRHYESDQKLFDAFTAKTGIAVKVLKGDADQLLQRLKAEGKSSPCDVFVTADVGRLYLAKTENLLASVRSMALEAIPAHLRDPQGYWFGLTKRARVVVYDKTTVAKPAVATYEDLARPDLKGKIVVRSSGNVYNVSLISALYERWGEAKTSAWAKGLASNLAQSPKGGDRDQMKAIVAGIGEYAVTNTYYIGQLITSADAKEREVGARMGVIFPNQSTTGTHVNVSGAGVAANAPNPKGALALIEFLASAEAQKVFAAENFEYPVLPGVELSPVVAAWGSFKEDTLNLEALGKNSAAALKVADQALWK